MVFFSYLRRNALHRFAGLTAALGVLAACSGGGGAPAVTAPGGAATPGSASRAAVTFEMKWAPPSSANLFLRRPAYLAPTALSASIQVVTAPSPWSTATPIYEVLNSPGTTLTFTSPTGLVTFLVQTYDEQNGLGHVLSTAFVTQKIAGTSANIVSATLNGVIAGVNLSVSPLQPTAGRPSSLTVSATGLDADGNVIVGPGTFASPIQLTIVDPAGANALSLSKAVIQKPGATTTLSYNGKTMLSETLVASVAGAAATASVTIAPNPGVVFYPLPNANSGPAWITVDSGSHLWLSEEYASKIARFPGASATTFTEYATPTAASSPYGMAYGEDGRVWFAENATSKLGALTPSTGVITEYPTLLGAPDDPLFLVDRGDGTMWYTGNGANRLGYQGEARNFSGETTLPEGNSQVYPSGIAEANDGYLYVAESGNSKIGRLHDLFGTVQEVTVPTPSGSSTGPNLGQMVAGPDGNLWVVDFNNSQIDRINIPYFTVTQFNIASPGAGPVGIAAGPDGALWFTESSLDRIGRITTSGTATEYKLPASGLGLTGIAVQPNGTVWFCAKNKNAIGRLNI